MKTLLVKNVKHLVTCDTDDRVLNGVNVLIQDGVIASIGQEAAAADDVIDGSNMVLTIIYIRPSVEIYRRYRTWNCFHG